MTDIDRQKYITRATVHANYIFNLALEHRETWRSESELHWLAGLVEEVGELAESLLGNHEHQPEYELRQIAAICLNWLDMRTCPPTPPPNRPTAVTGGDRTDKDR